MNSKHTFLLVPATWQAEGTYFDEDNTAVRATGTIAVEHQPGLWICAGIILVHSVPSTENATKYEILPFADDAVSTAWISHHPELGTMTGTYTIIDDSIMSSFASTAGFHGVETLLQVDGDTYFSRGMIFRGSVKVASWSLKLVRERSQ